MRRLLTIGLIILIIFSLVACTSNVGATTATTAAQSTTASTTIGSGSTTASQAGSSATKGAAKDAVKVGVVLPLTGSVAAIGKLQLDGIKLFVQEANEKGGIKSLGGAKIELVIADSTGKPEIGVTEMERLITNEKVSALLGPYNSSVGAATAPIADKYKVPYVLTNSTADEILINEYKYVFRANVCNGLDAVDLIGYIEDLNKNRNANIKKVAIVYENTDWGKGMSAGLKKEITASHPSLNVVLNENYEANAPDFSAIVNKIKAAGPDIVIPMNYLNDALLFVKTMADYKVNVPILAHSGGYTVPEFLKNAGKNANFVMTFSSWDSGILKFKNDEAKRINERYKKEYSNGVDMDTYSANGWLGAAVMVNAIERSASTETEKINTALAATDLPATAYECTLHPFQGIKFGKTLGMTNQNLYAKSVILQILDGKFTMIAPTSMVPDKDSALVWPIPAYDKR